MSQGAARRPLFKHFPTAVQKDMGVALFVVQLGGTPPSAKQWKGLGSGAYENRELKHPRQTSL